MAITFPLPFPTITKQSSVTLIAKSAVSISRSPFTFAQQVQVQPGRIWEAQISLPPMKRATAETWIIFLLKLNGAEGTFLMGDPLAATARGSASETPGTPLVDGAEQTGGELLLKGLPASASNYLLAGDYIQLGTGSTSRLYKVLVDASSDSAGGVTLDLWPDLRILTTDSEAVVVASAVSTFRLASNVTSWNLDTAEFYGIDFSVIEAI